MNISVIVPLYKGKKYVCSILEQIRQCKQTDNEIDIEVIFVNDYPEEKIELNSGLLTFEVKVINSEINRGVHGARVLGLEHARGELILFLDQDDLIFPQYFVSQMREIKDADVVVCKAIHNKLQKYDDTLLFEEAVTEHYMLGCGNGIASPGQVLLRKRAISESWKTNTLKCNGADDWFLWICMFHEGKKFILNNEVLYEHVVDGKNLSWQSEKMLLSELEMMTTIKKCKILKDEKLQNLENTILKLILQRMKDFDKFRKMFLVYDSWMNILNHGKSVAQYLIEKEYRNVAIYGGGYLGKQLYQELKKSDVNVCYFIDRNASQLKMEIPVYSPIESFPEVDIIIVSLVEHVESVIDMLEKKIDTKMVSIVELIEVIENTDIWRE